MRHIDRYVTAGRVRFYGVFFTLLTVGSIAVLLLTAKGNLDMLGRPIGTDFSGFWSAGLMTREEGPLAAYDLLRHLARQIALFGTDKQLVGYHYPPVYTLLLEALSALPYLPALLLFQLAGCAAYLFMMQALLRDVPWRLWIWPVTGFPALWVNIMHGQNGVFTAALFGGGLALLRRHPFGAGLLLGALCYKPQFGLLIPLALVAGAHRRAFGGAALSVILLTGASYLRYGQEAWEAFFAYASFTQHAVIETDGAGWYKMQTVFAAARMWGAPIEAAYIAHGGVTLLVAVLVWRLWRSPCAFAFKAAGLMTGALLVSPYVFDYDLMLLGPVIAFLGAFTYRHGPLPYGPGLLAFAWAMPFFTRILAQYLYLPAGAFTLLALFLFTVHQAAVRRDLSTSPPVAKG